MNNNHKLIAFIAKRKAIWRFLGWFYLINAVLFWLLGWRYLHVILSSKTLFVTSFADYTSPFAKLLVLVFAIISYIGQLSLLAFIPCVIVLLLSLAIPWRRTIILIAVMLATISVVAIFTDSMLFTVYRFHLNITIIKMTLNGIAIFDLAPLEKIALFAIPIGILLIEFVVAWVIWNYIIKAQRFYIGKRIAALLVACLVGSYLMFILSISTGNNILAQQTPNLPLYTNIMTYLIPVKDSSIMILRITENRFSQPLFATKKIHYPLTPIQCQPPAEKKNIIFIVIDTWRFNAYTKSLTPNVFQFTQNALWFNHHFSGGNSTQPGIFSLFFALPSNYWSSMLKAKVSPVFINQLLRAGYQIKVFNSAEMTNPNTAMIFRKVKGLHVAQAPGATVGDRDRYISKDFISFLTKRDKQQPFFAFLFYDAAHAYCETQNFPKPYQPAVKNCFRLVYTNETDPTPYLNRYKNALHFVDGQLGGVFKAIQAEGLLKNSVIVITGDHGQEFNDNHRNYWEHASNFTPYQTQTPLLILWPGKSRENFDYVTSHYDLVPTLMHRVLGCATPYAKYSIGYDLFAATPRPFIIVGGYMNMGYITDKHIVTLSTSGDIRMMDLHAKPLPHAKPNLQILNQVLYDMRRFYQ